MSKSKPCGRNSMPPLKAHFSSVEPQDHHNMEVVSDYEREGTGTPEPSFLPRRFPSRKPTSSLALRRGIASGAFGKRGQPLGSLKPEQSPVPRVFVSRKFTSSLALRSRLTAGSGKQGRSSDHSKGGDQCHIERSGKQCQAADKSEKLQLASCSQSKPESLCCEAQAARRESCVSFQEPVAWNIPIRDSPCPELGHPTPVTNSDSCAQKAPQEVHRVTYPTHRPHTKRVHYKRPQIVVPLGEGTVKHKEPAISSSFVIVHHKDHKDHQDQKQQPGSHHHDHAQERHPMSFIPYSKGEHPSSALDSHHRDSHDQHPGRYSDSHHHDHMQHHGEHHQARSPNHHHSPGDHQGDVSCHCEKELPVSCPDSHHHDHCFSDPHCSTKSPPCANCAMLADLTQQMTELNRKLEGLQKDELPDIRQQLECLNASVKALAEKCEAKAKPEPACPKSLSTCQFCRGQELPLLNSFHVQLKEKIGNRSFTDVVISVFLRADNIYHVNVRDLNSGSSLSCFLVTDEGIAEAQQLGLFQQILTFTVIDVRNTLKPRNCALGITFELVPSERQKGGSDSLSRGICLGCKPFVARVLGLPLQQLKYLYASLENSSNYPEKSLRRFRSRIARIQAGSSTSQGKSKPT